MKLFSPWNRAWRSLRRQPTEILRDRRREWDLSTRQLVISVLEQAKKEFSQELRLIILNSTSQLSNISVTNLDSILFVSGNIQLGIGYTYKHNGKPYKKALVWESSGGVAICQATTGEIIVSLYQARPHFPKQELKKLYKFQIDNTRPRSIVVTSEQEEKSSDNIIYGIYEPHELTERKLKKIVSRSISFILETRTSSRSGWYTAWLLNKDDKFYRGLFWGFLLAIPASATWELIKPFVIELWVLFSSLFIAPLYLLFS